MRAGRVLALAGVLSLSGAASAESLIGRVGDAVDTWATGALLEAYGTSRPVMIAGRDVSLNIAKAGRIIKWGGPVLLTAGLLNDGLNWFYNEAKKSTGTSADLWYKLKGDQRVYPDLKPFSQYPSGTWNTIYSENTPFHSYFEIQGKGSGLNWSIKCNGNTYGKNAPYSNPTFQQALDEYAVFKAIMGSCAPVPTLSEYAQTHPDVAAGVRQALSDYLRTHPEIGYSHLSPVPNANQKADAVVDPGLDTDEDEQTDGDETRTGPGVTTNPGNRPHPGDGPPSDPNDPTSKAPDTDKDGVPDWRDGDDDNDGIPDDDEPNQPPDCQKNRECTPDSERDTDGDGIPDRLDDDDDDDGFPDAVEEREGSNPKDKNDKPTDKPCSPGSVRGPDGSCKPEEKPPCPEGSTAGPDGSCKPDEPPPCKEGTVRGPDGKCEPEKDDPKCPEGKKLDSSEPPKCVDDLEPKDPVDDTCGNFGIKRLLTHTGHYLRDVVFPCEDPGELLQPIVDKLKTKFPFSITTGLNGFFTAPGAASSSELPDSLGMIPLDWGWVTPLWAIIKSVVGVALWAWFGVWLIDRFTPRAGL